MDTKLQDFSSDKVIEDLKKELEQKSDSLEQSKKIIIEKERLASLGQMLGGIAHNLKTPIMSISTGLEVLKNLIKEYDQSIDVETVTKEDHHEISREMLSWIEKLKPQCAYISDIISTVKCQAVPMDDSEQGSFTIDELIKRIDILMKHELQRNNCKFKKVFNINMDINLHGEINNLVQVFNNLINNAIDAYENRGGEIEFKIYTEEGNIVFSIKDNGRGIRKDIKDTLFKAMITTKGKNGTGLGLYISYATIKSRFGGDICFDSEEGKGTTFNVLIPLPEVAAP